MSKILLSTVLIAATGNVALQQPAIANPSPMMLKVDSYAHQEEERAYENRQYYNRQYNNQQYFNRQYTNRQYENRQYYNRQYNQQQYELQPRSK